jgi:hypothetical protein
MAKTERKPLPIPTILKSLADYAQAYLKIAPVSVMMNNHTSKIPEGAQPPQKVIETTIIFFVKCCQSDQQHWQNHYSTENILESLEAFARQINFKREGQKALVVDFINYIGTMNGLNYRLTTDYI